MLIQTLQPKVTHTETTQLFDRNENILNEAGSEGNPDLVEVEAGAPCRHLKNRTLEDGTIEWLMQVTVSRNPGDVAFAWIQPKNI